MTEPGTTPEPDDGTTSAPGGAEGSAPQGAGETPRRGMQVLAGEEFSFAEAIGGVRGLVESALPAVVFITVFVVWRELTPALVASAALALLAVVVRLVQRTPMTQAFSGVIGIGIAVVWAWRTGEAADFFVWGLVVNLTWAIGATISVLVRWPVVGVLVSLIRGEGMSWRTDPAARGLRRRYVWATWLWVGVFGARLAVQVPLYLQGTESVGWLGTARLIMGVPLFALGLWITWLLVASPAARAGRPDQPPSPPR